MVNNELTHWGILGMKWGVRRYQNKDGTLTDAGKKRYDRDTRDLSETKKKRYKEDPDKWVSEDVRSAKRIAEEGANLTRTMGQATGKKSAKQRMDLSKMSEQELRSKINRELLERQYSDLFSPPSKVDKGKAVATSILQGATTALAVTGAALGVIAEIRHISGKG